MNFGSQLSRSVPPSLAVLFLEFRPGYHGENARQKRDDYLIVPGNCMFEGLCACVCSRMHVYLQVYVCVCVHVNMCVCVLRITISRASFTDYLLQLGPTLCLYY